MSQRLLQLTVAAVRVWTRVYTWKLPPAVREARRAEVESDLWESAHDPDPARRSHLPLRIVARLLLGIRDDLGWRLEQEDAMTGSRRLQIALTFLVVSLLVSWIVLISRSAIPPLPEAPQMPARVHVPPPPPPPPPPSADGRAAQDIPFIYGETSYVATGAVTSPRTINFVRPVYPPIAVWSGVRGIVGVEATVDERGRVAEARVVQRAHWVLEQSALNAVRQWQFEPTTIDGVPVPVVITATVDFSQR